MNSQPAPAPGWYKDPAGRNEFRWWDGIQWRDAVLNQGLRTDDALARVAEEGAEGSRDNGTRSVNSEANLAVSTAESEGRASTNIEQSALDPLPPTVPEVQDTKLTILNAKKIATELRAENQALRDRAEVLENTVRELDGLEVVQIAERIEERKAELAEVQAQAAAQAETSRAELESAQAVVAQEYDKVEAAKRELTSVESDIIVARERVSLEDRGLYDYEHVAEASATLATELESVRAEIKSLNKYDKAIHAATDFSFNGSNAKGRTFVNQMSRIMLRAYNAEAENAAKTVKAGNLEAAQRRLSKARDQIEKQGALINLGLDRKYHWLRLREIELAARHLQALAVEKAEERARREDLREQRKAEQELRREKERLEKERTHYLNSIERLRNAGDADAAHELEQKLATIDNEIAQADYRAANIRAGYVYVISNVGAFGEGVVKIGMTRRLEPMDRVRELGDASVPFTFDVHALFFADDAVGIEAALHREFAAERINQVNMRKEFFRVTPADVLQALKEHQVSVLEFRADADAEEFRTSQALLAQPVPEGRGLEGASKPTAASR